MNRRQFTKHGLAAVAGVGAGYGIVTETIDQASAAAVSMGDLSISDASKTTPDGTIAGVDVSVSGNWEYNLPSGKSPHRWRVRLSVTDEDSAEQVTETYDAAKYLNSNGSYEVSGSVTDTSLYSPEDFKAPEGKVRTVTLGFVVSFDVLNENGDVLATSQLSDTAEVSVTNEAYQPDEHGSADGTGEVTIQT